MMKRTEYDALHNDILFAIRLCVGHINRWSAIDENVQNSTIVKNLMDALQKLETFEIVEDAKND